MESAGDVVTGIAGCMPVLVRDENGHINSLLVDQLRVPPQTARPELDPVAAPGNEPLRIWNGDFWEPILGVRKLDIIGDVVRVYCPGGIICASPGLNIADAEDSSSVPCGSIKDGDLLHGALDPIFGDQDPNDPTKITLSVPDIPADLDKVRWSGMNKLIMQHGISHSLPYKGAKPQKVALLLAERAKPRFVDRNIVRCLTGVINADEAWLFGLWAGNCRNLPSSNKPYGKWCIVLPDLKALNRARLIAAALYTTFHFYLIDRAAYLEEYIEQMPDAEGEDASESDEEDDEETPSPIKRRRTAPKGGRKEIKTKERPEKVLATRLARMKRRETRLKTKFYVLAVHKAQREVFTEIWKDTFLSTSGKGAIRYMVPIPILNASREVRQSFIDGLRTNVSPSSWVRLYGSAFAKAVYTMARSLMLGVRFEMECNPVEIYRLKFNETLLRYDQWKVNHVDVQSMTGMAVYHISTESGQIVAGVGSFLCRFDRALN